MKDNGDSWPKGTISIKNNVDENIRIARIQEISLNDLILCNVTNITSKEWLSCISYQHFLNSRPPSLTSDLDLEYQFLMEECGSIQDETRLKKRDLLNKAKISKSIDIISIGEKLIDDLRWLEV